jgi:hypothetical protein
MMPAMTEALRGWDSDFRTFAKVSLGEVMKRLEAFVPDASPEQVRAWKDSIPSVQREVSETISVDAPSGSYTAVLEYQLPLEFRRTDVIFLMHDAVVVLELKGKSSPSMADVDQAQAYARDLRAYHALCEFRPVHAVLVPTLGKGSVSKSGEVFVCPPAALDQLLLELNTKTQSVPICAAGFLSEEAYRPLPTLVRAARELFENGTLRRVKTAAAATDDATNCMLRLAREAASQGRRKLVLLSGVPGAGKTLVGLRLVHSHLLDELSVDRATGKPTAPAVFLSGNGPLVDVLSYELKGAGGNGRTFVRGVKQYMQRHLRGVVPQEHVLVYDEAQRAYDAAMVAEKHDHVPTEAKSEPQHFIEFAERVPGWCVVVALIGGGQEIHKGEEAGTGQWSTAIKGSPDKGMWDVHGPASLSCHFDGLTYEVQSELTLDRTLRSHLAFEVHKVVARLVDLAAPQPMDSTAPVAAEPSAKYLHQSHSELQELVARIAVSGYHLRVSRDLKIAKEYLRNRYADDPLARFGLLASSRDRDLKRFDVNNDFQSTKRTKFGPWYGDDESAEGGYSCRHLRECVTEFGAQGLELDGALIAWGTDFKRKGGSWDVSRSARYQNIGARVRDPAQLRANAYRVLLTRARDVSVVFVPPLPELDETFAFLIEAGFTMLSM